MRTTTDLGEGIRVVTEELCHGAFPAWATTLRDGWTDFTRYYDATPRDAEARHTRLVVVADEMARLRREEANR